MNENVSIKLYNSESRTILIEIMNNIVRQIGTSGSTSVLSKFTLLFKKVVGITLKDPKEIFLLTLVVISLSSSAFEQYIDTWGKVLSIWQGLNE